MAQPTPIKKPIDCFNLPVNPEFNPIKLTGPGLDITLKVYNKISKIVLNFDLK